MKQCLCCKEDKPFEEFHKHTQKKDGYYSYCKLCKKIKDKASYEKYKEARYKRQKEWNAQNIDKVLGYKKKYRDENKAKIKEWFLLNKETKNKLSRAWKKANKAKVNAQTRKRQASQLQRTPKWLTGHDYKVIEAKYAMAAWLSDVVGINYHVDHIIPLRGIKVSGLHMPDNLSIIKAKDNMEKGNKYGCEV